MAAEQGLVIECQTKDEFDDRMDKAKKAGKLVIINFANSWSGPCRSISPVYSEYAKKHPGAVFLMVNVNGDEVRIGGLQHRGDADLLLVKNGETVETIYGAQKDELHVKIDEHLGDAACASA